MGEGGLAAVVAADSTKMTHLQAVVCTGRYLIIKSCRNVVYIVGTILCRNVDCMKL